MSTKLYVCVVPVWDQVSLCVVGRALVHEIHGVPQDRIVVLENMLDKEEIEQKLARAIQ